MKRPALSRTSELDKIKTELFELMASAQEKTVDEIRAAAEGARRCARNAESAGSAAVCEDRLEFGDLDRGPDLKFKARLRERDEPVPPGSREKAMARRTCGAIDR